MENFCAAGEIKEGFIGKAHLNLPLKVERNVTPKFISSGHMFSQSLDSYVQLPGQYPHADIK